MERPGMSYNEARSRVLRMSGSKHGSAQLKGNVMNSILNQVKIREGSGAVREIVREMRSR